MTDNRGNGNTAMDRGSFEENSGGMALFNRPPELISHAGQYPLALVMDGLVTHRTMSYAASEAAKSDAATVCSGSVTEDIDLASIMSGELGSSSQAFLGTAGHSMTPSSLSSFGERATGRRSGMSLSHKHERGVEFAVGPSIVFAQSTSPPFSSTQTQHDARNLPDVELNDMGPPHSRALLLERCALATHRRGPGSFGTGSASRADSVRSFGSINGGEAPSDVVAHVDTDDCGGSLVESEGRASIIGESHSFYSQDDIRSFYSQEDARSIHSQEDEPFNTNKALLLRLGISNDTGTYNEVNQTMNPLHNSLSGSSANGRTSPGGTVYKGKGVRRYQGRYMHLPLKRFHQNGVTGSLHPQEESEIAMSCKTSVLHYPAEPATEPAIYSDHQDRPSFSPLYHHHERWARHRSRSRSKSRDRNGMANRSRSRSRSRSPPRRSQSPSIPHGDRDRVRDNRTSGRKNTAASGPGRWRGGGRHCDGPSRSDNSRYRHHNNNPRRNSGGDHHHHRGNNNCGGRKRSELSPHNSAMEEDTGLRSGLAMPPREPRHCQSRKKGQK